MFGKRVRTAKFRKRALMENKIGRYIYYDETRAVEYSYACESTRLLLYIMRIHCLVSIKQLVYLLYNWHESQYIEIQNRIRAALIL